MPLETIWRSFQRPPARTSWPIFAMSRGRKRNPPPASVSPLTRLHSTAVMPKGSNNVSRANSSSGRPVALRTMADTSASAPVL